MTYLHVINRGALGVKGPMDRLATGLLLESPWILGGLRA